MADDEQVHELREVLLTHSAYFVGDSLKGPPGIGRLEHSSGDGSALVARDFDYHAED